MIALIEAVGVLASCLGWLLLHHASTRGRVGSDVRPILSALLSLSALIHGCDLLEALGLTWADRLGDAVGVFRPAIWIFLLFSLARTLLMRRLRFQEQQVRFFLEQTPAAVAVFDRELRYLAASQRWQGHYGSGEDTRQLQSKAVTDATPDVAHLVGKIAEQSIAERAFIASKEVEPLRVDGRDEWVTWAVHPWTLEDEVIGGVVVLAELVTEKVQAEEQLRRQQQALLHESRLETVGVVAGGVAHDIRNFLMAVSAHAEYLGDPDVSAEENEESITAIREAVHSASAILSTLTSLSRRDPGQPERVELGKFLLQTTKLLNHFLPRSVQMELRLPQGQSVFVQAVLVQLQQVVLNLAINARDAMPRGGTLTLGISARPATDCDGPGGTVAELSVADTGTGITEPARARLFEPLFTTKELGKGTGLGLAIVGNIVRAHQGSIEFSSKAGEGTTFFVTLPCEVEWHTTQARVDLVVPSQAPPPHL